MSGWVKWEKDLETDPRFVRLVRQMRNARYAGVTQESNSSVLGVLPATVLVSLTMGCLMKFWAYADTHIRTDNTLDLGFADIDELVGISGFASSLPEDWLVNIDESHVELPEYQQHNGIAAKKAALAQKRMEKKRTRERRNDSVTPVTHQRNGRVTGASPDQTRPDQTKTRPPHKSGGAANGFMCGSGSKDVEANGNGSHTEPAVITQNGSSHDPSLTLEQAQELQSSYPRGIYRQAEWLIVEQLVNQHLANGVAFERIHASFERYAAQCRAKETIGTQYVLSPVKHCDLNHPLFDEPFELPKTKAEVRQDANADAGAAWLARSEAQDATG